MSNPSHSGSRAGDGYRIHDPNVPAAFGCCALPPHLLRTAIWCTGSVMPLTHGKWGVPSAPPHSSRTGQPGRAGRNRTRNLRFWRPSLYQLSYDPMSSSGNGTSARFPVKLMTAAPWAELLQLQTARIIPPVLLGRVIPLAANGAFERNHRPISLRLLGHCTTSLSGSPNTIGRPDCGNGPNRTVPDVSPTR